MKDKIVPFRTYDTLPEAQYVKDALEQNGVRCFLSNVLGSQLYPLFNSSVCGIRVMIAEQDVERAEDILSTL